MSSSSKKRECYETLHNHHALKRLTTFEVPTEQNLLKKSTSNILNSCLLVGIKVVDLRPDQPWQNTQQ